MSEERIAPEISENSTATIWHDLVRKIRLQRGIHGYYELRAQRMATVVKVINIALPAHIVFLVFSDLASLSTVFPWLTPNVVAGLIGAAGFILFVTSVLTEVFTGNYRHLDHRQAIEGFGELLQEIEICDLRHASGKMRREMFESFNKRYRQITVTSPKFTDKQFERAMAYLLRSKALKLARKANPFANALQLRKIARSKVADVLNDRSDPLYGYPFARVSLVETESEAEPEAVSPSFPQM